MNKPQKHIHHSHHHFGFSYPVSFGQKLYSMFLGPLVAVLVMYILLKLFSHNRVLIEQVSINQLFLALGATFVRLVIAYVLAVIVGIPLALIVVRNAITERIFLPLFDIFQSIPILAFFPILIVMFIKFNQLNGAAIIILFLSMLWNIVFTLVGGLKMIPKEISEAAEVFHVRGFSYLKKVTIPSIFPQLITGSILAFAQGWNIIIVAEVLHTYIPGGTSSQDLFGIGSILVRASSTGQTNIFILTVMIMVLAIAFLNFFIWQKLLHYAQRYKFE